MYDISIFGEIIILFNLRQHPVTSPVIANMFLEEIAYMYHYPWYMDNDTRFFITETANNYRLVRCHSCFLPHKEGVMPQKLVDSTPLDVVSF